MITVTKSGRKYLKLLASGVLICGLLISTGCNKRVETSNALSDYNYASSLAESSLGVLMVYDKQSYNHYKVNLKNTLSAKIYNEYFSSDEYSGYDLSTPKLDIKSIKGDMTNGSKMVFKIDINYNSGGYSDEATMLVTVEGNLVTYIERI